MKKSIILLLLFVSVLTLSACSFFDRTDDVTTYSLDLSANIVDAPLTFSPTTLEHGTEVTVTAADVEGYTFVEWLNTSNDVVFSEQASFTFVIESNMAFKAIYESTTNGDKEVFVIETGFNEGVKTSYAEGIVEFGDVSYVLNDALIGGLDNDQKNGTHSVRLREGFLATVYAVSEIKQVSFSIGNYLADATSSVQFEVSTDGETWLLVEDMIEANAFTVHTIDFDLVYASLSIDFETPLLMRIKSDNSARVNIDDFTVEYTGTLLLEGVNQDTVSLTLSSNVDDVVLSYTPGVVAAGTLVNISAGAKAGYNFVHWINADTDEVLSETANFTLEVNDDLHLTAVYEADAGDEVFVYETGFNENLKSSYAEGPVTFDGLTWILDDALIGSLANDQKNGSHSIRLRNGVVLASFMVTEIKEVSFNIGNYLSDSTSQVAFEVSEDGLEWLSVDSQIDASTWRVHTIDFDSVYETLNINPSAELTIRITSNNSQRVNIDDFKIFYTGEIIDDYTPPAPPENYSVTLSSNVENAVLTVNPSDPEIVEGTQVLVSAGSLTGYTFKHWEDAVTDVVMTTDRQYTFTLESDVSLRAVYESEVTFPNDSTRLELTLDNVDYYYSYGDEWTGATCTVLDLVTEEPVDCLRQGEVDTNALGSYNIVYYAEDAEGKFVSEVVTKIVFRDASLLEYDYSYNEYYQGIEGLYGDNLLYALRDILNDGVTLQTYGDSRDILQETDADPDNENNIILVYRQTSIESTWDGGATWNREHVWPQSLLGVSTNNSSIHVGSDLHNLKPANPSENSSRGNRYFDVVDVGGVSYTPPPVVQGDIARIMFYMDAMYDNLELVNTDPAVYEMAKLDVLIMWHYQDSVDAFEMNRNDIIYSYQNNRNPFIDYPHLVELIWYDHPNIPLP